MHKILAVPALLVLTMFTAPSPAAPLDRALERIAVMTKVRVLLTAELRTLLTASEYAAIAPTHSQVRALRDRQIVGTKRAMGLMSKLFEELIPLLDEPGERAVLESLVLRLDEPVVPERPGALAPISEDGSQIIGEALDMMRTLERVSATLGEDLQSTKSLVASVDRLLERASRTPISQLLGHALLFERVQMAIAPIFARHSLAKLCRDRLVGDVAEMRQTR